MVRLLPNPGRIFFGSLKSHRTYPSPSVAVEEDDRGTLVLRLDLPPSPLLALTPVLLLVFENLLTGDDVQATFTSHSLQPNTQVKGL